MMNLVERLTPLLRVGERPAVKLRELERLEFDADDGWRSIAVVERNVALADVALRRARRAR